MHINHHIAAQLAQEHQRDLIRAARIVRVEEPAENDDREAARTLVQRTPEAPASGATAGAACPAAA